MEPINDLIRKEEQMEDQDIKALYGHDEGEELPNEHGTEVVVYDRDAAGNIIGWHKVLKEGQ